MSNYLNNSWFNFEPINIKMNVLVLTPDAVGSTLLQRLVTVYMQLQSFSKPIINLHELTNGLHSYYSEVFNQEVLGKPRNRNYHQSLAEILRLLESVDHYKTSRLAKYHLDRRNDSLDQQISFYNYLNENFFIIATRRKNIFEHAISWCINSVTKKLNVYNPGEKILTFIDFYKDPVTIDPHVFKKFLNDYKLYVDWSTQYFNIGSIFCYEHHVPDLEKYVLDLPIFNGQSRRGWEDTFDISFSDWNVFHHLTSDLESIATKRPEVLLELKNQPIKQDFFDSYLDTKALLNEYDQVKDPLWPEIKNFSDFENLPVEIKKECTDLHKLASIDLRNVTQRLINTLDHTSLEFIDNNKLQYNNALSAINKMEELGILVGGLPIKKQTLAGKKAMVKNWKQCIDVYNQWITQNPDLGSIITDEIENTLIANENQLWSPKSTSSQQLIAK